MSLLETRLRWRQVVRSGRVAQLRVGVLASFTVDPLTPYLGTALEEAGLPAEIQIGPYNQIVQQCLLVGGEMARHAPDVLVVWPRLEELWGGVPLPLDDDSNGYVQPLLEVAEAALTAAAGWSATLIFVLPAAPEVRPLGLGDASTPAGVAATAAAARESVRQRVCAQPGALLVDMEEVVRTIGSVHAYDPRLLALAHIPFTEEAFATAGRRLATGIALSRFPARRAIALDADGTLWGGVVGEDGVAGVTLGGGSPGEAYRDFQSFLIELRRAGVLLTLCSKNEEEDVWGVFARREMRLTREHLAAWRIGWQPKSTALAELAAELRLPVESFVLVDDNPAEIAEVRAAHPGVGAVCMPADPAYWLQAVQAAGVLDRLPPTDADLDRAEHYERERRRDDALRHAPSLQEYLADLEVSVRLFAPDACDVSRLAQLIAKTSQFNLNCRRRSEAELMALCADPEFVVHLVQAHDRYGDYGIVGAVILRVTANHAVIDTFVLSCRALGRGIEQAMLVAAWEEAEAAGARELGATVEIHPRNEPAQRFFASVGSVTPGTQAQLERPSWPAYVRRT
jgi:FkbH-like protein